MRMLKLNLASLLIALSGLVVNPSLLSAASVDLSAVRVTDNAPDDIAAQLQATASDASGPSAFTLLIKNVASPSAFASFISTIYIQDDNRLLVATDSDGKGKGVDYDGVAFVQDKSVVEYEEGGKPGNLPGGNDAGFDADLVFSPTKKGSGKKGIDLGEMLGIILDLRTGVGFSDIDTALADGSLSVGLHVQGIGEESDSFIFELTSKSDGEDPPTGPPDPAAAPTPLAALAGLALMGWTTITRRRRHA